MIPLSRLQIIYGQYCPYIQDDTPAPDSLKLTDSQHVLVRRIRISKSGKCGQGFAKSTRPALAYRFHLEVTLMGSVSRILPYPVVPACLSRCASPVSAATTVHAPRTAGNRPLLRMERSFPAGSKKGSSWPGPARRSAPLLCGAV